LAAALAAEAPIEFATTLNVYGHVLPHDLGLATDAMARSIERSRGRSGT
jgi:hypothetical protein